MGSPAETVLCPKCNHSNPSGTSRCTVCNAAISEEDLTVTEAGWSFVAKAETSGRQTLVPGTVLSGRYEILKLLGAGGMGAVYKAKDLELDRFIALRVIRAELAGQPKILQRFKQELILARQITHRNVIRIFDLGTHEGVKYITAYHHTGPSGRRGGPAEPDRKISHQLCFACWISTH